MNFRCIKRKAIAFVITGVVLLPLLASAQVRRVAEYQITKITPNLISTPQISYSGAEQFPPQYSSAPDPRQAKAQTANLRQCGIN